MIERHERGSALLEQVVAAGLLTVVVGVAIHLLTSTSNLSSRGHGQSERLWTRAKADRELASAEWAAAELAYFDLSATVAGLRRRGNSSRTPSPSGPPPGYCGPVVPTDPSTWPPNFDPRNRATWTEVTWWSGASQNDPTTWYWDCGGAPSPSMSVMPVYSYGSGVTLGRDLAIVGPVAVTEEASPLFADQVGQSLTLIRAEASLGPYHLGSTFDSASGVIQLIARDETDVAEVEALSGGDVLVVTGKNSNGTVATAIAQLSESPRLIAVPSPTDTSGIPLLRYYEARVLSPDASFRWGLGNASGSMGGASIAADAAVALLDRNAGVLTYYTSRATSGLTMWKVVGDPTQPESREAIVPSAACELRVTVETAEIVDALGNRQQSPTAVEVTTAVASEGNDASSPVHTRVAFVGSAHMPRPIGVRYGEVTVMTTPLPSPQTPPGPFTVAESGN